MDKENHYGLAEVKKKFQSYRRENDFRITHREFKILCEVISCLPKEILDKVMDEVYFVVLSGKSGKEQPACYLNLNTRFGNLKNKSAIIFLSPLVFNHKVGGDLHWYRDILHEVAHHFLGHYRYENQEDYKEKEEAADKLAKEWIMDGILKK